MSGRTAAGSPVDGKGQHGVDVGRGVDGPVDESTTVPHTKSFSVTSRTRSGITRSCNPRTISI